MEKSKTTPIKNLTNSNYKQVISDILENYKTNPEDLIELARFSKNFTKYSINNDILLYKQNSGATFVATYNQWQNLGYKVIEKGSGIKLLQPNTLTFFYNENNELKPIKEATKIEQKKIKNKEYKTVRKIVSFSTFIVHDISATNCPVEEYPNFYNMGYPSEIHKNIADALIDYCSENKIMVSEQNLNSISLRGLAYKKEDVIKLNSLMKDTQRLSTLVHEIGHIKLHRDNEQTNQKSTALKEFEADLLSIMFSTDYNLEIIDTRKQHLVSSFKAIDKENFDLMKTLNEVHKEYKKLSKEFDKYIDKQLTINNISLDNDLEKNRLSKIKEILDNGNYIQKSVTQAKAGEFCIGENKNPLQIIEKNGNEYKAIDLVTKKEINSSFENRLENKDINNIATVPIPQKSTDEEKTTLQGYKKYNLDEINQIPIKTILDDLGYEKARSGKYNIRGENTASVKVYENTNTYYDFGSTNGGGIIHLVMETQNMDKKEAINFLGERYSIPYEQIGVDNTEKRLFLSNKEWQNLGLDGNHSSKNYIPNENLSNEEHTKLISRLSKINMNDLIIKEPMIFKSIIENNVIPSYIDNKNYYLSQLYNNANCEKVYGIKNQKEKEVVQGLALSMAKEMYITLQNNYNSLKKIKEFIPDLKIDKLQVDFKKDLKNINNKSIEIGSFKYREMKELDGIKNYLTIPYKNYAEFEKEAKDFSYSAFLKGDKVTLTVLNTDKQQAGDLISQVKQLDFQKQQNISLEK